MKLGLQFGNYNDEAWIIDLDHNDQAQLFRLCLNKDGRDESDYPKENIIKVARDIIKMYNSLSELKKLWL